MFSPDGTLISASAAPTARLPQRMTVNLTQMTWTVSQKMTYGVPQKLTSHNYALKADTGFAEDTAAHTSKRDTGQSPNR